MQINFKIFLTILSVSILTAVLIGLFTRRHLDFQKSEVFAEWGMMNGQEFEPVDLPPFISSKEVIKTFESFNDQDSSVSRTSLASEYLYYFSIKLNNSEYRVYLNKKANLANEFHNPTGASKIRELLLFSKGEIWFDERFENYE